MKRFLGVVFIILAVVLFPSVLAQFYGGESYGYSGSTNNWQYYQPNFNQLYGPDVRTYWPILGNLYDDQCEANSDFVVMIPPGGCSPAVVRSDLLEEQNVPVFCQLQSLQVNPLIEVSSIKSISFKGDYPEGVSGISFHPARAATRSYRTLLGDPVINNIGYVVIILKRNKIEDDMEKWIAGNLTATIYYDAEEAYGVGQANYYLPRMSDNDWEANYTRSTFWKGLGYLRMRSFNQDSATIDIYNSKDHVYNSVILREGQTSSVMYFPGYYCRAGMKLRLDDIVAPDDMVLLNIDGFETWVRQGTKILNGQCTVRTIKIDDGGFGSVSISCPGQPIDLKISKKEGEGGNCLNGPASIEEFFNKGTSVVKDLVDTYPTVTTDPVLKDMYAEIALREQIDLAERFGDFKTQEELIDLYLETYPDSSQFSSMIEKKNKFSSFNFCDAYENIFVTNKFHSIGVSGFDSYGREDKKADIMIGNTPTSLIYEGNETSVGDGKFILNRILPGEVKISYVKSSGSSYDSGSVTIPEGERKTLGGREIYVRNIDVIAYAYVSLIPEVKNTKTEADFTFKIGIEKRNIQLSTEKTEEMLKSLNSSIEKWNGINERLGKMIKVWKGTCLATSGFLMIKNVLSGFSGEGLARQKVMAKYKSICDTEHSELTRTQCYNELSDEIDKDVKSMTEALGNVNEVMDKNIGENVEKGGLLGDDTIVNQEKYIEDLKAELGDWSRNVNGVTLNKDDLTTSSQVRAALLYKELEGTGGVAEESAREELDNILKSAASIKEAKSKSKSLREQYTYGTIQFPVSVLSPGKSSFVDKGYSLSKTQISSVINDINGSDGVIGRMDSLELERVNAQIVHSNTKDYLYLYDDAGAAKGVWEVSPGSGKLLINKLTDNVPAASGVQVQIIPKGSCSNKWPAGKVYVRYYESGVSKGLPAIVPFNLNEGWYAMVPNSAGTFLEDSPKGYDASGVINYFKICNIGSNKLMEEGTGDDLCQTFDVNTARSVETFVPCPGLSSSEVERIYSRATEAIRQASRQFGNNEMMILDQEMYHGNPASNTGTLECQDFMSPSDCMWMFNVCDPVICPSSRCDLGGKMPVADVIQSGIVGSLMLCLPNFKEGIYVPICLSGVHAGIDTFVSILESERDCLEKSLETGEHVGICDEITSIYKCEFFWRQAAPVMNLILPRLIEGFTGGSSRTRGGGEYLLVQNAFDNLDNSINYFKNTYAPNAFRAFQFRNVEEAGGEFCRAFVGTSFPTSADMIDSLLEPESPSQFYAHFSSTTFSDATIPATAQYKVYFHIYAGNDRGAYYRVYLKNPPASGYYATNPYVDVKTGFISPGDSADESIDFTAPEGYKELCVVINTEEHCGFKQVTSDFGLQLIQDKYVEEQANNEDIQTEGECISGTPSAISLVSPNVQSGVEETINPEIAMRGIVRVCASESPDNGVGSGTSRWKKVGTCGTEGFYCWLDRESVGDSLTTLASVNNATLSELDESSYLLTSEIKTEKEVMAILVQAKKDIEDLQVKGFDDNEKIGKIISALDGIVGLSEEAGVGTDRDKANALFLKALLYRGLVDKGLGESASKPSEDVAREAVDAETSVDGEELSTTESDGAGIPGILAQPKSSEPGNPLYYRCSDNYSWQASLDGLSWEELNQEGLINLDKEAPVDKIDKQTSFSLIGMACEAGIEEIKKNSKEYALMNIQLSLIDAGIIPGWFGVEDKLEMEIVGEINPEVTVEPENIIDKQFSELSVGDRLYNLEDNKFYTISIIEPQSSALMNFKFLASDGSILTMNTFDYGDSLFEKGYSHRLKDGTEGSKKTFGELFGGDIIRKVIDGNTYNVISKEIGSGEKVNVKFVMEETGVLQSFSALSDEYLSKYGYKFVLPDETIFGELKKWQTLISIDSAMKYLIIDLSLVGDKIIVTLRPLDTEEQGLIFIEGYSEDSIEGKGYFLF